MFKNILVPVDGSKYSKTALEIACDLADKYDAGLHLLHVILSPDAKHTLVLGGASVTVDASDEEIEQAGHQVIEASKKIAGEHGVKDVESDVVGGPTAQRILEYAKDKDIDMIVMGSRGLSDISGLLIGSVSHKVSHLARCTCVTVH
ncbi:MAG TPA: universal stress protein [Arenicellales bacterium]|nr:universal stress protein [Arenicellales bacterium]